MVKAKKPYMLRRWRLGPPGSAEFFFTCARPGRNTSKDKPVDDSTVHAWILGLPGPETAIVSLLGRKADGTSEFSFYSFYGGYDKPSTKKAYSFQKWIDKTTPIYTF